MNTTAIRIYTTLIVTLAITNISIAQTDLDINSRKLSVGISLPFVPALGYSKTNK